MTIETAFELLQAAAAEIEEESEVLKIFLIIHSYIENVL